MHELAEVIGKDIVGFVLREANVKAVRDSAPAVAFAKQAVRTN